MELSPRQLQEALERQQRYLWAVAEMQRSLSAVREGDLRALTHVLEPLGQACDVSRAYLFENHRDASGQLLMSQRAEWCAAGVQPEIDNPELQGLRYAEIFPRWPGILGTGRPIHDQVRNMPTTERELFESQDIQAILIVPLMVQDAFIGFIGFDDCASPRAWSPLEIDVLQAAAVNIGLHLDQRRVREELERTNQALVAARDEALQAVHARTTFLAKVSHELRTPLNAVIGYAELVLDAAEEGDWTDVPGDVERIRSSGRYLLSMVDDLLTLTQLGTGEASIHARAIDLDAWLDELLEMWFHPRADLGIAVRVERDGPLGRVHTDPRRLNQILINLLSNALKYTPRGHVILRAKAEGDHIVLAVEDTGIGMGPDDLQRIFDEFFQADLSCGATTSGVGLGLPITKRLCEALGAELTVTSALGVGSCFTVRLPRGLG